MGLFVLEVQQYIITRLMDKLIQPISFSKEEKIISIFDRMSKKEIAITRWDRVGRGNTSVTSTDGASVVRSYLSLLYRGDWFSVTVDDITGIEVKRINEDEIEEIGPLIWLKDAENSNW
jgi:hypothetical protein